MEIRLGDDGRVTLGVAGVSSESGEPKEGVGVVEPTSSVVTGETPNLAFDSTPWSAGENLLFVGGGWVNGPVPPHTLSSFQLST